MFPKVPSALLLFPISLFLLSAVASGQATLDLANGAGLPGSIATLNLNLGGGANPAGAQLQMNFTSSVLAFDGARTGPAASAAGKSVSCAGSGGSVTCLVVGFNTNTMSDGNVAKLDFQIAAGTSATSVNISLSDLSATDAAGGGIGVLGSGSTIAIQQPVNGDPAEEAALLISAEIQERHLPHGTIMDPVFATPESLEIVSYSRAGDSAIWSGHYLAAEAFRFQVTRSPDALDNARRALEGIRFLVDVTGTDLLARAAVPVDSPFAEAITLEELRHGIFTRTIEGRDYNWIGNTSRDQYMGVFVGLSLAFDLVDDTAMRSSIGELVTRMLLFLLKNQWFVVMPDGRVSTLFLGRPDQKLTLLQVGRQVNPTVFGSTYRQQRESLAGRVVVPIAFEVLDDHNSYFKFNLDAISLFNLIRLEDSLRARRSYGIAYQVLRRTTDDHGNAHFNMIDRALTGPDTVRDSETIELLETWLDRPRRDEFVDLRGQVPECGPDRACEPIPVRERVRTDFLWQRSPFLLFGGGESRIEGPGIDFILPYWMARFFGLL